MRASNMVRVGVLLISIVIVGYICIRLFSPQVVSCYKESKPRDAGPNWEPTLRVKVEPNRNYGLVKEYQVLGCRLYYYHTN